MSIWRKLTILALATVAVLAFAGTAGAAAQASASGNGAIFEGTTFSQDFSFGARVGLSPFSADGHLHVVQQGTDPNTQYRGRINCMIITANRALMSGTLTEAPLFFFFGPPVAPDGFIAYAEDNGEPGELRDRWNFIPTFGGRFFPGGTTDVSNCVAASAFTFGGSLLTSGNIDVDPL